MKKRFLIPAVTIALLGGMAVHGSNIQKTCVPGNADYEAGTGICNAKNAFTAKQQQEQAKPAVVKTANQLSESDYPKAGKKQVAKPNRSGAIAACQIKLEQTLRDPGSVRYDRDLTQYVYESGFHKVALVYNAKNGFGGYAGQDIYVCSFK